jgi:hypothetical protein
VLQIEVLGTTPLCAKCRRAKRHAIEAANRCPRQVEVVELDALGPEAEQYGLMTTSIVAVGDEFHTSPGDREWEEYAIGNASGLVPGELVKFIGLAPSHGSLAGPLREVSRSIPPAASSGDPW